MVSTLTLFHAASSAVILLIICLITYVGVARDAERQNTQYITDEMEVLRALLRGPDAKTNLLGEMNREQAERSHVVHYIRILDAAGRSLLQNAQMELILPGNMFPSPSERGIASGRSIKSHAIDGNTYILQAVRIQANGFERKGVVAQVAFDVTSMETFLASLRLKLSALFALGVALSAVGGYLTARRGLSPLARITGTTEQMTAYRLDERIRLGQWPRELATLAEQFNGMLDRLKGSFDGLYHYTGNLAHELRTPINNLMIEGDLALLRERTPEEYQRVIGSSMEEYERLSRLIDSLLFLARCDSSVQKVKHERIDVGNELQRMAEFYSALCMDQNVEISCQGSATVSADAVLFRRAVSNLVSNALKYTPSGGKITLSAMQREDRSVEVSVSDTGAGMEPEQLPHIFERFYRAADAEETGIQGYGLGLSIVKAIMNMHQGSIDARSLPGQGTTVSLVFPPSAVV